MFDDANEPMDDPAGGDGTGGNGVVAGGDIVQNIEICCWWLSRAEC